MNRRGAMHGVHRLYGTIPPAIMQLLPGEAKGNPVRMPCPLAMTIG